MEELDKGSADGTGLDEAQGVGLDGGVGLDEGLAEFEERRFEVEALQAKFDEGAAGRQRGRQGTRPAMRQADKKAGMQAMR